MLPKAFALALAVVAGHGTFPLESHSLSPDNEFAGSSQLRLWWILAPVGVSALVEAFDCLNVRYLLGKVNGQVLTFLLVDTTIWE